MTPDQIAKLPPELQRAAELCEKATPGPWNVEHRHASAGRCDGISAHVGHTHPLEQSCWDVDECPGQDAEMIVQTDSGFYGPNADDADFIARARTALPLALTYCLQMQHAFKNFHRALCSRFDYCHDEKDWERDQVSLEEHIAAKLLQMQEERDARDAQLSRIAETVAKLPTITGLQEGCVKDHSLIWMAIRDAQDTYRDTLARHQREAKQHAKRAKTAEATIATLTREKEPPERPNEERKGHDG